jgi:hypothetical protein
MTATPRVEFWRLSRDRLYQLEKIKEILSAFVGHRNVSEASRFAGGKTEKKPGRFAYIATL